MAKFGVKAWENPEKTGWCAGWFAPHAGERVLVDSLGEPRNFPNVNEARLYALEALLFSLNCEARPEVPKAAAPKGKKRILYDRAEALFTLKRKASIR